MARTRPRPSRRRFQNPLLVLGLLTATLVGVAPRAIRAQTGSTSSFFNFLKPIRWIDTRAVPERVGPFGRLLGGQTIDVQISGQNGTPGIPATAAAVVLNVTAVDPGGAGFLTLFPAGAPLPTVSNVNFTAGRTVPNLSEVKIGANGQVSVYNGSTGEVDVILDVSGYWGTSGLILLPADPPFRVFDSAAPQGTPLCRAVCGPFGGSRPVDLRQPLGGIKLRGVFNVTVDAPTHAGWVKVYGDPPSPLVSNVNFSAGETRANVAFTKDFDTLFATPPNTNSLTRLAMNIEASANLASARVILDQQADFDASFIIQGNQGLARNGRFVPLEPCRLADTRPGPEHRGDISGPIDSGPTPPIVATGRCGLPTAEKIQAIVANITAVNPTADGYLTLYPANRSLPDVSNVNFKAGEIVANHAIVKTSPDGRFIVYNLRGDVHFIVDVFGYITTTVL